MPKSAALPTELHRHIGTPGWIRTYNHMILNQAALPISVQGHNKWNVVAGSNCSIQFCRLEPNHSDNDIYVWYLRADSKCTIWWAARDSNSKKPSF